VTGNRASNGTGPDSRSRKEYPDDVVEKVVAQTVEELAEKLSHRGLGNPGRFMETLREFNKAVFSRRRYGILRSKKKWEALMSVRPSR
jgi:tetraacyldisaccharide-1-P 4'-kinase